MITWPPTTEHILASNSTSDIDKAAQEMEETISYNYLNASSIGCFPLFTFNSHSITSLSTLISPSAKGSWRINILAATFKVEGPDTVMIKRGYDTGKQVLILKMILGDNLGNVAKLTAWREVADLWGGNTDSAAVK